MLDCGFNMAIKQTHSQTFTNKEKEDSIKKLKEQNVILLNKIKNMLVNIKDIFILWDPVRRDKVCCKVSV